MIKYKVPAYFNGKKINFIVSTSMMMDTHKIILFLFKKYRGDNISINSNEIETFVELEYSK